MSEYILLAHRFTSISLSGTDRHRQNEQQKLHLTSHSCDLIGSLIPMSSTQTSLDVTFLMPQNVPRFYLHPWRPTRSITHVFTISNKLSAKAGSFVKGHPGTRQHGIVGKDVFLWKTGATKTHKETTQMQSYGFASLYIHSSTLI